MTALPHIALVSSDSLDIISIQHILAELFDIEPVLFANGAALQRSRLKFDLYIMNAETFTANLSFFMPRRNKIVLIAASLEDYEGIKCINRKEPVATIIETLRHTIQRLEHNTSEGEQLSQREIEVLKLIVRGHINKEIAEELNISINTVLTHRKNISSKLGIRSVSGLSVYAMMNGYLSPA